MMKLRDLRGLALLLVCTGLLSACLPEDKDPAAESTNAGQIDGAYYGAALGNVAMKIQNSIVSDPTWLNSTFATQEIDLAARGIKAESLPAPVKSVVCHTGTGTEVMQITWMDGKDTAGKFALKGLGLDSGTLLTALKSRVASDQLGTFTGNGIIALVNNTNTTIPTTCGTLAIPVGAPVIAFMIDRPAPPTSQLSRTEFRTVACAPLNGIARAGARVQKRVVLYKTDGTVRVATAAGGEIGYSAAAGWSDDNMSCVDTVDVAVNDDTSITSKELTALNDFAAMGLKDILIAQINKMDCRKSTLTSIGNKDGKKATSNADIDTCGSAVALTKNEILAEDGAGTSPDERTLQCAGTTPNTPGPKPFELLGTTPTNIEWSGTATLIRTQTNSEVTGVGSNQTNYTTWVGKPDTQGGISCKTDEKLHASCLLVAAAPKIKARDPQKWIHTSHKVDTVAGTVSNSHYIINGIAYFYGDDSWSWGNIWGCAGTFNLIGEDCLYSGYIEATYMNSDYFRETSLTHDGGVDGEKRDLYEKWQNATTFTPKRSDVGEWDLKAVDCEWVDREPIADCPSLMASDNRHSNWNPQILSLSYPMPKAMTGPGMDVAPKFKSGDKLLGVRQVSITNHIFNTVRDEYNKLIREGNWVADVTRDFTRYFNGRFLWITWDDYTYGGVYAGPGTDTKYLKAWRSGDTQTTLFNTDGVRIRKIAVESPTNRIAVQEAPGWSRYKDAVHCGTATVYNSTRPAYVSVRWQSCDISGCWWDYGTETRTIYITGGRVQEWKSSVGWSNAIETYTSSPNVGTWHSTGAIPSSFSWSEY